MQYARSSLFLFREWGVCRLDGLTSPPQRLILLDSIGVSLAIANNGGAKGIPDIDLTLQQARDVIGIKGINLLLTSLELHGQFELALILSQNQVIVLATTLGGRDRIFGSAQVVDHVLLQVVLYVSVLICAGRRAHQGGVSTAGAELFVHVRGYPIEETSIRETTPLKEFERNASTG